jgi:ribosomal protein S18 acetylase RimI-like enzyme
VQKACRRFLAQNPIANGLVLGDLYSPLFQLSEVYCAKEDRKIVGTCSIYRAYKTPSVVFAATTKEIKQVLIEKALSKVANEFVSLCEPKEVSLLEKHASVIENRHEQQMVTNHPRQIKNGNVPVERVSKDELPLLNQFYVEHHSGAWTQLQFKVGPYYCVKQDHKIVSAAGVHVVTPQTAQLGNIITDEAYRNRGYATACTGALASHLSASGRVISLFVRTDNAPAIRMYEKLGFRKKREIAFLFLRKNP